MESCSGIWRLKAGTEWEEVGSTYVGQWVVLLEGTATPQANCGTRGEKRS
jgi:hypothetical protein